MKIDSILDRTRLVRNNERCYSTESLLLHLTESWGSALDRGHKVGVLFIDFRKAFDCVNHSILTEKLKAVGLAGDMWKWINDYLSNRVQGTSVSGSRSDEDEAGKRLWQMLLPLLGYSAMDMWRRKNEECLIGKTGLLF